MRQCRESNQGYERDRAAVGTAREKQAGQTDSILEAGEVGRNDREEVDAMHLSREFLRRGVAIGVLLVAVNPPIFPCKPI